MITKRKVPRINPWNKAKEFMGISKELDKRLKKAAYQTWMNIGEDILASVQQFDGRTEMKRTDVIEVVSDADHMLTHGNDDEAYAYFLYLNSDHREHLDKIMKEAFPFKYYCI
jgi:predicted aconitase